MTSKLRPVTRAEGITTIGYMFWCPGCLEHHVFYTNDTDPSTPRWSFNEDPEAPTFSPSLLNRKCDGRDRCHLFLREGQLQFLSDCTHSLAGKTVPLEPEPEISP